MTKRDVISAGTSMSAVTLKVADLDAMTAFYRDGVGLSTLAQAGDSVVLGSAGQPLVILEHSPLLKHAAEGAAGLFHTALLFPSQASLARALYSVATKYPGAFTGSSDHLVSEALYFDDPEGNGVELYWDRPRSTWQWNGNHVAMDTRYLDPNAFLQAHLTDAAAGALPAGATVGHVHLKVGDIASARAFYADTLGFEVTAEFGAQALFVSAGGYHHHLGMNTWQSRGALDRSPALGLGQVAIELPDLDDVGALRERLSAQRIAVRDDGRTLRFDDPWKNEIAVSVR
ncbi:VOC family protein [Microbacterium sp. STN6]|uniref:VOC family protein n=1 Tax=Microbacterium sp. STN6 TaxID=2995588 RepID=UPI0022608C78|nr:VOC family protein [Microbacterium sp. STN6]MCX7521391.1 VOC family protein [Microbacterium sp. STN6]